MQKNVPKYAPPWIRSGQAVGAVGGPRGHVCALRRRRTLLWFANQRAVEYHPALIRTERWDRQTHLILDIDPPAIADGSFGLAVQAAYLVSQALEDSGLAGAVKTSGAKGVHVIVPLDDKPDIEDVAAATRALAGRAERLDPDLATTAFIKEDRHGKVFIDSTRAGGATVVAAYSPRIRPGRAGARSPCRGIGLAT